MRWNRQLSLTIVIGLGKTPDVTFRAGIKRGFVLNLDTERPVALLSMESNPECD